MNFKNKLFALAGIAVVFSLIISALSFHSQTLLKEANKEQLLINTTLKNHLEGDMMHDAIRGDILKTLLAVKTNDSAQLDEVEAELNDHAKRFQEALNRNTHLELNSALKNEILEVKPALEDYIASAESLYQIAKRNPAGLEEEIPNFMEAFATLEDAGEKVSSSIESYAKTAEKQANKAASLAKILTWIILVMSLAALVMISLWVIRGVLLQLGSDPEELKRVVQLIAKGEKQIKIENLDQGSVMHAIIDTNESLNDMRAQLEALDRVQAQIEFSLDGTIINANQNFLNAMGYRLDEIKGKHHSMFVDAAYAASPAYRSFWEQLGRGEFSADQYKRIGKGGKEVWIQASYTPILNADGRPAKVIKYATDITEHAIKKMVAEQHLGRILGALETTTTNVMIADADRKIIYMNKSVESMLRRAESDLRAVLPHFSVDKIIGGSMDGFHRNPAHQAKLLESLATTYTSNIVVGKRHFRLVANPIFSKDGSRLGSVVEWLDRTEEVGVESEVNKLVEAAAAGDFSERIITEGKQGFFLKLAEGLNMLVQTADKGLNDVARVLGSIAKGDLTQKIDGDYAGTFGELKNYCNDTTDSLTVMLGDIRIAADTIFTASSEIAQGNADLSSRTEQQAANLEETASSMEELTSTVRLNADNAKQANVLAEQASTVATDGGTLIQQVVSTMNAINDSARKISDIIGVIDGIAFQTNILALNAAVEAARAGDQGRGFAVVASEVRTLAQRSANAAKDIKALISDSVQKIENGNELVGKSGNTMKEIVNAIKRVNDIMSEIAAASAEQSTGIEEVSTAVSQMDEMTQQNAALVEEAAAAAESLQSQADQLNRNVAQFKLSTDQRMLSAPTARAAIPAPAKKATRPAAAPKKLTPPPSAPDDEWEQF